MVLSGISELLWPAQWKNAPFLKGVTQQHDESEPGREAIRGKCRLNIETFTHCIMMPSSAPGKGDLFLFRQIQFSTWCTQSKKRKNSIWALDPLVDVLHHGLNSQETLLGFPTRHQLNIHLISFNLFITTHAGSCYYTHKGEYAQQKIDKNVCSWTR